MSANSKLSFDELFDAARKTSEFGEESAILSATEAIVARMDELGITRAELARRLGRSTAYVTKLLRGDNNFTLATLSTIAARLDCEWTLSLRPVPKSRRAALAQPVLAVAETPPEYRTNRHRA